MLHAREHLKKELEIKSIVTCAFGPYNDSQLDDPFNAPRKGSDGETAVAQSIWMNTIKGENSGDTFGIAQIQVDKRVVVSDI